MPTEPVLDLLKNYLPSNPIILEAGAYDGEDSVMLKRYWPLSTVHAFEPVPDLYKLVQNKIKHEKNIFAYPLALSDKNGKATFHVSGFADKQDVTGPSGSLRAPKEHLVYNTGTTFPKKIEVTTATIDDWAASYNVEKIDFIWFDLQGAELEAFKGATKILETVTAIYTEVEFGEAYEGQALFNEVDKWLTEKGFVRIARDFDLVNPIHWFGNAVYLRKSKV